nr:hypothetical protein GCM10020093_108390 [Planobispora longispora]
MKQPAVVSGGPDHLEELRTDPIALMRRVRQECGDVGEFRLAAAPWCCCRARRPTSSSSAPPTRSSTKPRPTPS